MYVKLLPYCKQHIRTHWCFTFIIIICLIDEQKDTDVKDNFTHIIDNVLLVDYQNHLRYSGI